VVQILVQTLAPLGNGESQHAGFVSEREATGSGVIVDPDGYIVTNAHVVRNARRIDVNILRSDERGEEPHGHLVPAKLIGLDRQVDIAVVKIEGKNLPALSFVNSDNLRQGQLVLAVGSPLGLQNSLTHGVVSATVRQLNPESPMVYIQTDAPINPGNSGFPRPSRRRWEQPWDWTGMRASSFRTWRRIARPIPRDSNRETWCYLSTESRCERRGTWRWRCSSGRPGTR
jgi:serine protease Do